MMDIGPPESKRPRIGSTSGPWSNSSPHLRNLPHPGSGPGPGPGPPPPFVERPSPFSRPDSQPHTPHTPHPHPHPLDDRRHHEQQADYAQQHPDHRPLPGPFHHQHPYAGPHPREPQMKRDPSDEPLPPHLHRPPPTGNGPEHNANSIHPADDHRRYHVMHYDPPAGPGPAPQYRPPAYPTSQPQTPMTQTPMGNQGYENIPYGHPPQTPREAYVNVQPPYAQNSGNQSKRKPQRAAQACDSCRSLKAKCDELKPCTSCKEKGIPCNFRDPPPKQQDKSQEVLLENVNSLRDEFRNHSAQTTQQIGELQRAVAGLVDLLGSRKESNGWENARNGNVKEEEKTQALPRPRQQAEPHSFSHILSPNEGQNPITPAPLNDDPMIDVPSEEEEDGEDPKPPGPPAMPVNHTTGAARLLLVGPIAEMTRGVRIFTKNTRIETFPIVQEERRGLLRLYGRGEGTDLARGYDNDALIDHGLDQTPSDIHSDASSPAAGEEWGQVGGLTPPAESVARGEISSTGMPDFRRETVEDLINVYMKTINMMHPMVSDASKNALIRTFLKSIADSQPKHKALAALNPQGSTPDSPGSKRKRSRDGTSDYQDPPTIYRDTAKPGHPFRSISTAMVLTMLALGSICGHTKKISDVAIEQPTENSWRSSPNIRNGHPPSPLQGSPTMSVQSPDLPSPQEPERILPHSRRTSLDGLNTASGIPMSSGNKPKNLDMIPGLQYFAMATDIIGNQLSGNSLQHVHTNILASLYHGQLGRVMESWGYLANACRAMLFLIRPRLARWEKLLEEEDLQKREAVPAKDNPYLFAFWTCLQLESDILAELPFRPTGILEYESKVPWPNTALARKEGFASYVLESYNSQLFLRKHLNGLHTMFYSPETDSSPQSPLAAKSIPIMASTLDSWRKFGISETFKWNDDEPPSSDILVARLRAKYYGARVITYRYFVFKILENSAAKSSHPGETISNSFKKEVTIPEINADATSSSQIDPEALEYARACITALIQSTIAFDHVVSDITKERLIVTNVWGTAHAQWGNVLTLLAVYRNPILKDFIQKEQLVNLLTRTIGFLHMIAQPSSALATDIKLLQCAGVYSGLLRNKSTEPANSAGSFSSATTGTDVPMSGR